MVSSLASRTAHTRQCLRVVEPLILSVDILAIVGLQVCSTAHTKRCAAVVFKHALKGETSVQHDVEIEVDSKAPPATDRRNECGDRKQGPRVLLHLSQRPSGGGGA